jgi:hypothetical protein
MTQNETVFANEANEVINGQNGQNEQLAQNEQESKNEDEEEEDEDEGLSELFSPDYESEALTKLRTEYNEAGQIVQTSKIGGKKYTAAFELLKKAENAIKAEISGIKKQKAAAIVEAKKAEITKTGEDVYTLAFEAGKLAGQNAPTEIFEAANLAALTKKDEAINIMLAGFKMPSQASQNGQNGTTATVAHGNVREAIELGYIAAIASGLNRTEAAKSLIKPENGGTGIYARGSVNTYIKDYLEGNGINKP